MSCTIFLCQYFYYIYSIYIRFALRFYYVSNMPLISLSKSESICCVGLKRSYSASALAFADKTRWWNFDLAGRLAVTRKTATFAVRNKY